MACGQGGTFWCRGCEADYETAVREVREVARYMGSEDGEGSYVLAAHELLEADRLLNLTSVGRAATLARARALLAEVTDYWMYSPMCVLCNEHKMMVIPGDKIAVTCTAGCSYE